MNFKNTEQSDQEYDDLKNAQEIEHRDNQKYNKEKFYVTNKMLMDEMIKYRDSGTDAKSRTISNELANMFYAIARKLTNHSCFRNYEQSIKDEMVSYASYKFVTGICNFNFKYSNPFAYFTQSCFNSFKSVLTQHYKQINIKRLAKQKALINLESELPGSSLGKCLNNQFIDNEYAEDF